MPETLYCVIKGEVSNGIIIGTIIFCLLEVVVHSILGIQMYRMFKSKGKQTIYGPGSITAYFCFGVFGAILCHQLAGQVITTADWIVGLLLSFGGIGIFCVLTPEFLTRKYADDYAYTSAGYFERFLK